MGHRLVFKVGLIILLFMLECVLLFHVETASADELNMPPTAASTANPASTDTQDCLVCHFGEPDPQYDCATSAHFDVADGRLMFVCLSDSDFSGASFRDEDLSGANLAHARLDHADFTGAKLSLTRFDGADLSHARGLTQSQLDDACGDGDTKLPRGLSLKTCS